MTQILALESAADSMTFAWPATGGENAVEFQVNDTPMRQVTLKSNVMKKKGLAPGDVVKIRVLPTSGFTSFTVPEPAPTPEAPRVQLTLADESSGAALVEFPSAKGEAFQVDMLPLAPEWVVVDQEWVTLSAALGAPAVRKRNLDPAMQYAFRYRAKLSDGDTWGPWSAISAPSAFPARADALARAVAPKLVEHSSGATVDAAARLAGASVVLLYFSASWCPPCRATTPKLVQFAAQLRAAGKRVEVVFVSADQDAASFAKYFKEHMPGFLAVPFEDEHREALQERHRVSGIPSLKVLSARTGAVVDADALQKPMDVRTFEAWEAKM